MIDDGCPRVTSAESMVSATDSSAATKQRKKRKWDQPADTLVAAGVAVPGIFPLGNVGSLMGIALPGIAPVSGVMLTNPLTSAAATVPQVLQSPFIQPNVAAVVQKINQPKILDELIAREIVINDADSAVRYKLTKRQTQEEIQKSTGAVVITRGKYRPSNAPPDGEKPLYLHISAGAHLKEIVERIKAVDSAAAMVEEMLKQGSVNNGVKVTQPLNTCVYLGFDTDPSLNIAARIRGPNDQYVNHIMNETGATVLLRGRGSGSSEIANGEEGQQPLHLSLSSNNPKSLEHAKLLAENLLDTISLECGASRVSSGKVYGAVPPPQQLMAGVQNSGSDQIANTSTAAGFASSAVGSIPVPPVFSVALPSVTNVSSRETVSPSAGLSISIHSEANTVGYSRPSLAGGTSYSGYGGIYPQATPLQQVALALRHPPSTLTSRVVTATTLAGSASKSSMSSYEKEKQRAQRRKFQESPVASVVPAKPHQRSEYLKPSEATTTLGVRDISTMPAPKKLVQPSHSKMPPPPPKAMPPPPPPPRFSSSLSAMKVEENNNTPNRRKPDNVPDTLIKLMEYGDDDDDPEEITEEPYRGNSNAVVTPKPFWAV